eukprot:5912928-Pleurochrysis_carterae.AAC.1
MTRMLDILENYCRYRDFQTCRIDPSTAGMNRQTQVNAFNAHRSSKFIFLLSSCVGGLGIYLQTADSVVIYDSNLDPQARDRDIRYSSGAQCMHALKTAYIHFVALFLKL